MSQIDPQSVLVNFSAILISLTVHEYAHAWCANKMGDPTPRRHGRLNLNPLTIIKAHPFGAFLIPLFGAMQGFLIGFAATPVNPRLVDRKYTLRQAERWISFAGPLSNLILAILCGGIYIGLWNYAAPNAGYIPMSPYRFGQLLGSSWMTPLLHLSLMMIYTNFFLMIFNLIPIPPLDGFTVASNSLPRRYSRYMEYLQRYQMIALLFVFYFGGQIIAPLCYWAGQAVISTFGSLL